MEQTIEYKMAIACKRDVWIPANGGSEKPTMYKNGIKALYVYNPKTGKHAYLNCANDMILTDAEVERMLP